MKLRYAMAGVLPLFLTGCVFEVAESGPPRTDTVNIEIDKSEFVQADFKMGAGEMRVHSGAKKLMEGAFTFSVPSWKPEVKYSSTGVRGYLTVEQPSGGKIANNNKYEWDIGLNKDVPLDLRVKFGAGEARLDLGDMALRNVEVELGVGKVDLDLRGQPKRDYDVRVRGGVGEATIRLPHDVGIYADATGGIGGINARGLRKEGHHYVNDAYQTAGVKVRLDVRGGIGEINLLAE